MLTILWLVLGAVVAGTLAYHRATGIAWAAAAVALVALSWAGALLPPVVNLALAVVVLLAARCCSCRGCGARSSATLSCARSAR